eukprot:jgi/Picre1/32482/NNA_007828.t1
MASETSSGGTVVQVYSNDYIRARLKDRQIVVLKDIHNILLGIKSRADQYVTEWVHTVIGAAIFYGPQNKNIQCRGRSTASRGVNNPVQDHVYSRKASGKYFMDNDHLEEFEEFFAWYWNKASVLVYVTSEENMRLKRYQQEIDAYNRPWQETYRDAGVDLAFDDIAVPTPNIPLLSDRS